LNGSFDLLGCAKVSAGFGGALYRDAPLNAFDLVFDLKKVGLPL
jgi:hypothetical protein